MAKDKDVAVRFAGSHQRVASILNEGLEKEGFTLTEAIFNLASSKGKKTLDAILGLILALCREIKAGASKTSQKVVEVMRFFEFVTSVNMPAVARFVPAEKIKKGTIDGVKVRYVDPQLTGLMAGLVEENIPAAEVRVDKLGIRYINVGLKLKS